MIARIGLQRGSVPRSVGFQVALDVAVFANLRGYDTLHPMLILLVLLQVIQVAILWLHDWIPLGPLNNVTAVRAADSPARLIWVTIVQSGPYTIGLIFSLLNLKTGFPDWLWYWLWISYGLLLAGAIKAWWLPYLVRPEPVRAARYNAMFGTTHSFLPGRNGIVPNTLHVVLHVCTAATLIVLAVLTV